MFAMVWIHLKESVITVMKSMNTIINKFLLSSNKFMPGMLLRFTYSACGSLTKNKEQVKKFKETGNST